IIPLGLLFYESSAEVSAKVWPLSTDRYDVRDTCHKRTSESLPLVEQTKQYHERQLILTDTSMRDWGAVLNSTWARGLWEPPWTSQHINVLELRAIHLALDYFLPYLDRQRGSSIIHKQTGGTDIPSTLQGGSQPHILSVKAVHLPGLQNQAADMLSSGGPWPGEWRVHPDVVKIIWDHFGMAGVDLFRLLGDNSLPSLLLTQEEADTSG
ncbi:hypothetical protein M9458_029684, partial [Cirrhinus mrigala]